MSKHTPGPWKHLGGSSAGRIISAHRDTIIAFVDGVSRGGRGRLSDPESSANAHLIAAAPEMLKQLKILRDKLIQYAEPADMTDIRETSHIIDKAEGK